MFSGRIILNFGFQKRLRAFLKPIFTGEVTPSGSLRSPAPPRGRLWALPETLPPPPKAVPLGKVASPQAMTEGVALRESVLALSGANAPALPKGEPLAWRYSFRLKCKVYGLARASPFGRGGTAQAVTERASPFGISHSHRKRLPAGRQTAFSRRK